MATQLNPGADAVLVAAAYRAAMANVPLDYSKAFEQVAEGYGKYTEGMVELFKPIAQGVGAAAKPLVEKVKKTAGRNLERIWEDFNNPWEDDFLNTPEGVITPEDQNILDLDLGPYLDKIGSDPGGGKNQAVEEFQERMQGLNPDVDVLPQYGVDGMMGPETEGAMNNIIKRQEELKKSGPYIRQQIEFNNSMIEEWEEKGKPDMADRFRKRNLELEDQITPVVEPGSTLNYTNASGQKSSLTIGGQDDYIHSLKNERRDIEEAYRNKKVSKQDRDTALENVNNKLRNVRRSQRAFGEHQLEIISAINDGDFNAMATGAAGLEFLNAASERGRNTNDGSRVAR